MKNKQQRTYKYFLKGSNRIEQYADKRFNEVLPAWVGQPQISKQKQPTIKISQNIQIGKQSKHISRKQARVFSQNKFIKHPETTSNKQNQQIYKYNTSIKKQRKSIEPKTTNNTVNKQSFTYVYPIGKGGFSVVWLAQCNKTKKQYAIKQMRKSKIIKNRSIHFVLNEKEILSKLTHPFMININYSFQDKNYLYLVLDLMNGGDLRFYINKRKQFTQTQTKFIIACILAGLQYLHFNNIIHRDIKPQNLVFDDRGYLRITDFGVARVLKDGLCNDNSGTPCYMAPEVINKCQHTYSADYFAVGSIAYQLMFGKHLCQGILANQLKIFYRNQIEIAHSEAPEGWSTQGIDFINKMIKVNPSDRLGSKNGIIQIKEHLWFKKFNWSNLLKKIPNPPFKPINITQSRPYLKQIKKATEIIIKQSLDIEENEAYHPCFKNYDFNNVEKQQQKSKIRSVSIDKYLQQSHNNLSHISKKLFQQI